MKEEEFENDIIIGTVEPVHTTFLVTVEKLKEGEKEPYFNFFNGPTLEESSAVARIDINWAEYVTDGEGRLEHFDLSPEQIAAMLSFMKEHPTAKGYENLTNWQYCLVLFNKENKDSGIQVDEKAPMPDYARGLVRPLIELEPLGYYLGIHEQLMDDVHDFLLNKIEDYNPHEDNMFLYDDQIIQLTFDLKIAKEFLELEKETLEAYGTFNDEKEMMEEVQGIFAAKRDEIKVRQMSVEDLIGRELQRMVLYNESQDQD